MLRALAGVAIVTVVTPAFADDIDDGIRALVKASAKQRNPKLLAPLAPIFVDGIAWRSEGCTTQFGGRHLVEEAALPAFVECVAALELKMQTLGAMYEPGSLLLVAIDTDHHLRIDGTVAGVPPAALVDDAAFAAHFKGKRDVPPDPETKAALASAKGAFAYASGVACADEKGAIDAVMLDEVSPAYPGFTRAVVKTIAGWKGTPFTVKKAPVRACFRFKQSFPKTRIPDAAGERDLNGIRATLPLEQVAGSLTVTPDPSSRKTLDAKRVEAIGSWYVCPDGNGAVAEVHLDHSTGYGVWDSKIKTAIKTWKFKPIELGASTAKFCARYTISFQRQ